VSVAAGAVDGDGGVGPNGRLAGGERRIDDQHGEHPRRTRRGTKVFFSCVHIHFADYSTDLYRAWKGMLRCRNPLKVRIRGTGSAQRCRGREGGAVAAGRRSAVAGVAFSSAEGEAAGASGFGLGVRASRNRRELLDFL